MMLAFHGKESVKDKYLSRVEAHRKADQIIKGQYWGEGKGCAVGCTIHGSQHHRYETVLGIPTALAKLEDAIFEGLPNASAVDFPASFLQAIPVGADLSMVAPKFTIWLLTSPEIDLAGKADDAGKKSIATVADLYRRWIDGDKPPESEWAAAWAAAGDAAWAAAGDAAGAAAWAAAGDAAGDAAWAAAWAAAGDAAWDAAWEVMAKQILILLSEAPIAS